MVHGAPDEPGTSPWETPGAGAFVQPQAPVAPGPAGPAGDYSQGPAMSSEAPPFMASTADDGGPGFGSRSPFDTAPGGPAQYDPPLFPQPQPEFDPRFDPRYQEAMRQSGGDPFAVPDHVRVASQDTVTPPPFAHRDTFAQPSTPAEFGVGHAPADQATQVLRGAGGGNPANTPTFVMPPEAAGPSSGSGPGSKRRRTLLISALAATAVVGVTAGVVALGGGGSSPTTKPVADASGATGTNGGSTGVNESGGAPLPVGGDATATGPASAGTTAPGSAGHSTTKPPGTTAAPVSAASFDKDLLLHWRFTGGSVTDSSGHGVGGTVAGPVVLGSEHGGSATFTATQGQIKGPTITAGQAVVDTTKSFTVSAWVNQATLATPTKYVTLLSQDGKTVSGFWLSYSQASGRWGFGRAQSDVAQPATDEAWAKDPVPLGSWQLLTGVYDADAGSISFYLNGVLQTTVGMRSQPYASTGSFVVGRSWYNNYPSNPFNGSVADVRVYRRALSAAEVKALVKA